MPTDRGSTAKVETYYDEEKSKGGVCGALVTLLKTYVEHYGLLFRNYAAVMMMIGTLFRFMQTAVTTLYYIEWFANKFTPEENNYFKSLAAVGSAVGGPCATFMTGLFVDIFQKRTEMTMPMVCILKTLIQIPLTWFVFGQDNFALAMVGVYGEYFLAKGWTSAALLILGNVVDP